jgi:O-antigen/teichoic acid export membrane protein
VSASPISDATTALPGRSDALGRVARGSALNLVGSAVTAVCSFALVAVIARNLDRVEAGVFFSVTSVFLVATSIGQLGTNAGLVYFLARARALGQPALIGPYLRAALGPVAAVGAGMTLGLFVFAPQLGRLTNQHHAHQATEYLRILAWFVLPACLATVLLSATRGLGTMRANVVVEQVGRQLVQIALVAVAVTAPTTGRIAVAWGLPYVVSFVAAYLWWRSLHARSRRQGEPGPTDAGLARDLWRFTAPRTVSSVVALLMQRIDIVLVGALASAVQAAIFTAGTRFVVAGQMGGLAISLAVQPALAAALARDDHTAARHVYQVAAAWLLGVTWPLYLTFCLRGHTLLRVFGHGYSTGTTVLVVVTLGMIVGVLCGDVDNVQMMSGRTMWSLGNTVSGLAVMIGLDVWLIPGHGALGAAIGWAAAIAVKNLAGLAQVYRAFGLHPFATELMTMAGLNIVCFIGLESAVRLLPLPDAATFVLGLAVASIAYLAGLWTLRRPLRLDEFGSLRRSRPAAVRA